MVAADRFGTAITVCARRYHATVSHVPHRDRPPDFDTTLRELRRKSDVLEPPGPQHFQASFRHLTLYTSWYRTQVWSRLIAKELLTAFDPGEVFAADVARRHRGQILPPRPIPGRRGPDPTVPRAPLRRRRLHVLARTILHTARHRIGISGQDDVSSRICPDGVAEPDDVPWLAM